MGLPEILITFKQKASSAISRGSRGMAAVLLQDDTAGQFLTPCTRWKDVRETEWTKESLKVLKLLFKGGPKQVLIVRVLGTEGSLDLKQTLKEIMHINIDYLCYPGYLAKDLGILRDYITEAHEKGKKVKAVLPETEADDMHIINLAAGYVTARWLDEEEPVIYTAAEYCCRIAGILAGLPLTQSCTYYVLDEIVDADIPEEPDKEIDAGKLIIVFDGEKYKIGRGVTSLRTTNEQRPEEYKKIKIVEGMDVIQHDIYSTYENSYVGKVVNSYDNKQLFVGAVNHYLRAMQNAILNAEAENMVEVSAEGNRRYLEEHGTDTTDMTEQELKEADTGSYMFLEGICKFLDAAEDLNLNMSM
ncbi:MAG: phage tail sheath protein [Eubacterium sp.]|nr:phage tail sheath protein [Eubacterium sp.]